MWQTDDNNTAALLTTDDDNAAAFLSSVCHIYKRICVKNCVKDCTICAKDLFIQKCCTRWRYLRVCQLLFEVSPLGSRTQLRESRPIHTINYTHTINRCAKFGSTGHNNINIHVDVYFFYTFKNMYSCQVFTRLQISHKISLANSLRQPQVYTPILVTVNCVTH